MNKVAFITPELKEEFEQLNIGKFQDKQLFNWINKAKSALEKSPISGIRIPKKLWPKEYVKKWQITNLWKFDIPSGWRLIYTIEANDIMIVSIILEWFDHKKYERKFKY